MMDAQQTVDKVYKERFGQLVASLLYSSRDLDPETAEDMVQDSFSAALTDWTKNGVPLKPVAWIFKVCKNKALNTLRSRKPTVGLDTVAHLAETRFSESVLDDRHLALLFACAHPELAPRIQVVLTLKYVANLKVEAIARCLAMTIDGVDKLLLRARQKIRNEKILLEEPPLADFELRLPIVHKIIYLIFNEGYKSSWGNELIREELCEDALLMNKSLMDSPLGNKETAALHALMLFNSARFKSRFDVDGELVDLENQDRGKWNREMIALGTHYFNASRCEMPSNFHIEAYIAYLHCMASSMQTTDWKTITQLYANLLRDNSNPFIRLNYAVALYHAERKCEAFKIMEELRQIPFFNHYYLLNLALGKLHGLDGRHDLAKRFLRQAMEQTNFIKEKNFIKRIMSGFSESARK
jgi:RNA polymerase sigma-70 factor (ECF subfamily)